MAPNFEFSNVTGIDKESIDGNIEILNQLRQEHPKDPLIGCLNINSLGDKIIDLREIIETFKPDYFVVAETKINFEFPSAQFTVNEYEIGARRDRDEYGGGLMGFVRRGLICKRLLRYETKTSESIASEITINRKKWVILSVYRPPSANISVFFEEISAFCNLIYKKYGNIIIMGDININSIHPNDREYSKLQDFCGVFSLNNLINKNTCYTNNHQSSIDVILTNKPRSFQNTSVIETGLSDCHKLITATLKSHIIRLKPGIIKYRNYKYFNKNSFLDDLHEKFSLFSLSTDSNSNYNCITSMFKTIVDKHAPV